MKKSILFTIGALVLTATAGEVSFLNGSFEQGTNQYWTNQQGMVRIDTTDSTDGKQCLVITPADGKRVDIAQGVKLESGAVYVISFDARCGEEGGTPELTMPFMLQGEKGPLSMFAPRGEQKKQLDTPAALTSKWQTFTYEAGPFPEQFQGKDVTKIMIYFRVKGEGRVYLDNIKVSTKEGSGAVESQPKAEAKQAPAPKAEVKPAPAPKAETKPAPKAEAKPAAQSQPKAEGTNLLKNGSFEQGVASYWINTSDVAKPFSDDATDGKKSLEVTTRENRNINIVQGFDFTPGKLYQVSFDARVEAAEEVPNVKLTFMMQAATKPLAFYAPRGDQKALLDAPAALTTSWKTFTYTVGPFPEKYGETEVKKIMLYFNIKAPGKVYLDNVTVIEVEPPAPDITFNLPNPVQVYDNLPELKVVAQVGEGSLKVTVTDGFGRPVLSREGPTGVNELLVALPGPDYYLLRAEIIKGGKVEKHLETSMMVTTPLPGDYYETAHPAFGVWGGLTPELRALAGAKWDRQLFFTFFQKDDFQPTPPTPEKIAEREPIKIIRCMNVMHPFKKMVPYTHEELMVQKEKLIKEVVSRKGLVDVWETQNEPMVGENFHGTMNDVMDIIRMESEVVRQYDPGAKVAGICINPMNANQYNQYVGYYRNHGIADYIDSIMLHPYIPGAQSPDASGYVDILNRLGREVSTLAGRKVPMYISEIGYSTRPGGEVSEIQQAAYLARVVLLNRLVPDLVACVWHIGLWNDATSQRELDFGLLRKHGKGDAKREPKPAFAAWATVSRQTYNAEFIRELNIGRQVRVLLFDRQGTPLIVAYSLTPDTANFQLPINQSEVTITEVCGKTYTHPLKDGILSLKLTEAPVYISGGSLADFNSDKFAATFNPEVLQTTAGVPLNIDITLPEGLKGSIRVQNMSFAEAAVKGSGRKWQVSITPGKDVKPGINDIFIRLDDNGSSRYIWQKTLEILPPLSLKNIVAANNGKLPAISFEVAANGGAIPQAKLEILADGKTVLATAQVDAGKTYKLPLQNTSYGRPVTYQARFTASGSNVWTQKLPADILPVAIPYAKDALNTAIDKWPARGEYSIADGTPSRHAINGDFDRPEGTIKLAYDDKNLYFSVNTKDKTVSTRDGASMWDGDSLQIAVSVPQKFMIRPNNDGIQETAYAEFGIKAAGNQPDSWVWASMNLNEMPLNAPIPNLVSRHTREGEVTHYLFAISWQTLNIKPSTAMPLGISILINDRDAGKSRHWTEWYGGIADGKVPARYGQAVLLAK